MGTPIRDITIEGFKSIRSLQAFELRPLNILIGANGAGKSNFNDDAQTAPSKRLEKLFPAYKKVFHGNLIAQRIELSPMRAQCPHFADWLRQLAGLGNRE